jgi:hypothetical protein
MYRTVLEVHFFGRGTLGIFAFAGFLKAFLIDFFDPDVMFELCDAEDNTDKEEEEEEEEPDDGIWPRRVW